MSLRIEIDHESIAAFCRRNSIRHLSFFGSVLRDDFGPESDVDVLVEFEPGAVVGYFGMARMERELSEMIGRKVEFRTPFLDGQSPRLADQMRTTEIQAR